MGSCVMKYVVALYNYKHASSRVLDVATGRSCPWRRRVAYSVFRIQLDKTLFNEPAIIRPPDDIIFYRCTFCHPDSDLPDGRSAPSQKSILRSARKKINSHIFRTSSLIFKGSKCEKWVQFGFWGTRVAIKKIQNMHCERDNWPMSSPNFGIFRSTQLCENK